MKTKIINLGTILWVVLVALNESGVLELMPNGSDWVKFVIAAAVVAINAINAQVQANVKKQMQKSIGGGGISNPPPK